jgi:hypothetical protein
MAYLFLALSVAGALIAWFASPESDRVSCLLGWIGVLILACIFVGIAMEP